jgi:exopolysaccharide biosynthesis polyprenyl glycosylphosphotransferase
MSGDVSSPEWAGEATGNSARRTEGLAKFWMLMDALTVVVAALVATMWEFHMGLVPVTKAFWRGTLIEGSSITLLLALMFGLIVVLILTSRTLHLYSPIRLGSFLHEQRLSAQAGVTAGLMLTGTIYVIHAANISRRIVLTTLVLTLVALSLRRLAYRILLYRRLKRGVGTRNVLIVGKGPEASALRNHLEKMRHLGYRVAGFIEPDNAPHTFPTQDVTGWLDELFDQSRRHFVDEILVTGHCDHDFLREVVQRSRDHGINLRMVPEMFGGLASNYPIEYIGHFPTIPLHFRRIPELALVVKRMFDIAFSSLALLALSPVMLIIAIAIKLDSRGPVFYAGERIGKKGNAFKCLKFRTMMRDADLRLQELKHLNERGSILFKISNDPRITQLGRFLRKYSLDELPQFLNVLKGDMSVVGPRPPIGSEVRQYKLNHLRRLDVTPGMTGLWQVQARTDPSFESYISLDLTYVENWSVWLDIKIILRTIAVMFAGSGA